MAYWNSDITRCSSAWFWNGWGPVLDLDRDGELRRLVELDDSFVGEILYPPLCFCCWLFPWFEFIFIEYGYINYSISLRYRSRFHSATLPLAIPFRYATARVSIRYATARVSIRYATARDSIHSIPFHFISFIPFHSISFHFIPFHSISFHFISFITIHKQISRCIIIITTVQWKENTPKRLLMRCLGLKNTAHRVSTKSSLNQWTAQFYPISLKPAIFRTYCSMALLAPEKPPPSLISLMLTSQN